MRIRRTAASALAVLALIAATASAQTETYKLDPPHTSVSFKVRHMMINDVRGTFDKVDGTILLDPKSLANSSVNVTIETASVNTRNEKRDGHLKSPDFFDVAAHPSITFKSKKIVKKGEQWVAVGDLTIRSVTKEIELPFTVSGPVTSPYGQTVIAVSASAEINRQDFGVSWNKALDAGGVLVGDTVKIEIEAEAQKATS
jgi:polyisoprenoid-binding protein YceI